MSDNDHFTITNSRYDTDNSFSHFTKLLLHNGDVLITLSIKAKEGSWRVYDHTGHEHVGTITLTFEGFPGFNWSDGDVQADFETTFERALRNLAIVHYRKNYQQ